MTGHYCHFTSIIFHFTLAFALLTPSVHSRQPHGNGENDGHSGRIERGGGVDVGGKGGMGRHRGGGHKYQGENDLALWINEQQVKILSGNIVVQNIMIIWRRRRRMGWINIGNIFVLFYRILYEDLCH